MASGQAIQIADTSTMIVDINIDERNVGYVSNGMMVNLQDQMGNFYMGVIEQIALHRQGGKRRGLLPRHRGGG